jgi:thioredoxin 1
MSVNTEYAETEPTRAEIDAMRGPVLLEFGAPWCPHCQAAQPRIAAALARHPNVRHLKIEDGRGRRLGRTFQVKLWPTLIFLKDGHEIDRLTRPTEVSDIEESLYEIDEL